MLVSFATATPKSVPSPTAPKIGVKIARIGPTPAIATKIPTPAAHKRNEHNKKHRQPQQQSTVRTKPKNADAGFDVTLFALIVSENSNTSKKLERRMNGIYNFVMKVHRVKVLIVEDFDFHL